MARYCISCGSISKAHIPLFIAFIAALLEICHFTLHRHIIYILTDTTDHFTPLCACAARGNYDKDFMVMKPHPNHTHPHG